MAWVFVVLAVLVGAVLLWGVIDPASQWRMLVGWSTRDPAAAEPGGAVHALRRVICAIGLAGLVAVGAVTVTGELAAQPRPPLPQSQLERMWGSPVPRLLDRIVDTQGDVPLDLAPSAVIAVQPMTPGAAPSYLLTMPRWSRLGDDDPPGVLGTRPPREVTGYGGASLLVAVRGPLLCIPRAVVVQETEEEVVVGVYFGLPDPDDGSAVDHLAGCPVNPNAGEVVLVPVPLMNELDDRRVVTIDGVQLRVLPEV